MLALCPRTVCRRFAAMTRWHGTASAMVEARRHHLGGAQPTAHFLEAGVALAKPPPPESRGSISRVQKRRPFNNAAARPHRRGELPYDRRKSRADRLTVADFSMKRVRAVLCGEASVGKSSIIKRFSTGLFSDSIGGTIGGAWHSRYVRHEGHVIALEVWDTAGSERYHSVIPAFFKNAAAVVIVYDLTCASTFQSVAYWIDFVHSNAPQGARLFLVGNKADLFARRAVQFQEAKAYADGHGFAAYVESSAKTGESIETLFGMLADVPPNGVVEGEVQGDVITLDSGCC
jgi:small GTP-binding protein